jgi:hypothetical protein
MKHPILQPAKDHGLVVKPLSPAKISVRGFGFLGLTLVSELSTRQDMVWLHYPSAALSLGHAFSWSLVALHPECAAGVATDTAEVIEYFISVAQLGPTGREAGCRDGSEI